MSSESDSEAMRARGITVLVKFHQLIKKIETKQLQLVKGSIKASFAAKNRRFALLVGYNIQPSSSSTNRNAALIIDHQLDFSNRGYPLLALSLALKQRLGATQKQPVEFKSGKNVLYSLNRLQKTKKERKASSCPIVILGPHESVSYMRIFCVLIVEWLRFF